MIRYCWIVLILIFAFNIQITDVFRDYGETIESQMSWERFRIGLFSLIILASAQLPKNKLLTMLFSGFLIGDVIERLFFDTSEFDILNLLIIFTVLIIDFKRFKNERQH